MSPEEMQQRVAQIWQSTLQLDALPQRDDDIFALGADSLALTTMLNEVESVFKKRVDIEIFFGDPTIDGLCASMQEAASD